MVVQINLDNGIGIVRGDKFSRYYIITGTNGQVITSARLTIKAAIADAEPGTVQKTISSTNVAGTGQIEATGSTGTARLRFDFTTANTQALTADTDYYYDVQVALSNGDILTPVKGVARVMSEVTGTNP